MIKLICPNCKTALELDFTPSVRILFEGGWRNTPRWEMGLSTRSENCLKNGGFETAGQIDDESDRELLRCSNFGRRSLMEVRRALARLKGLQEAQA
jgi:DNA-directed RNA polymerase alpha subunit